MRASCMSDSAQQHNRCGILIQFLPFCPNNHLRLAMPQPTEWQMLIKNLGGGSLRGAWAICSQLLPRGPHRQSGEGIVVFGKLRW